MDRETVYQRLANENYHVSAYGREQPDICGGYQPKVTTDEGVPRLSVLMARKFSTTTRNRDGYTTGTVVGAYFYVYFSAEKYNDPYITFFSRFDPDKSYEDWEAACKMIKIHASEDGVITITHPDGKVQTHQLPVPDDDRCFGVSIGRQMDAGWPVRFSDD